MKIQLQKRASFYFAVLAFLMVNLGWGQVSITSTGMPYTQNFDGLASTTATGITWTNNTTIPGWFLFQSSGSAITTYSAETGSTGSFTFSSYGATSGGTERALGSVASSGSYWGSPASGAVAGYISLGIINDTGSTVSSFTLNYNGEQWRNGSNTATQSLTMQYGFGNSFATVSSWTNAPTSFNFTSPVFGSTAAAVNGNVAGRVNNLGGTISSLSWTNGTTLWIRWVDLNDSGNDHGLAIDDFSITLNSSGSTPPTLTAALGATVDAPFDVTFTDDATWRGAITGITIGGTALTAGYTVSAGKITFTPSASNPAGLLQTSGTKSIVVTATGYSNATVSQAIGSGLPSTLTVSTPLAAPTSSGGVFATMPAVTVKDQYNNAVSGVVVNAAVTSGQSSSWTLGGASQTATTNASGVATFSTLTATNITSPSIPYSTATLTFTPATGTGSVASASFTVPGISPTLTAAVGATVDTPFVITFTDNATWRSAVTSITVGGSALSASAYSTTTAGQITFTPSASALLQTVGSKSIIVVATGYSNASLTQSIGVGAPNKLAMNIQPTAPSVNGGVLATQPKVNIVDQYGNLTSSTASITASATQGTWTLGGTTDVSAISGTTTFVGLTATSASPVTGATITFTSSGLTSVTSGTFNIPSPPPTNDNCSGAIALVMNASAVTGNVTSATQSLAAFCAGTADDDVWYSFTTAYAGNYTITVVGSTSFDAVVDLRSGSCNGTNVSCADVTASGGTEVISATLAASTTYYVRVYSFGSTIPSTTTFTIGVTSPILTAPVANAATNVGSDSFTANWNAVANALNYQLDVFTINPPGANEVSISEGFEGSVFPPLGWSATGWTLSTTAGDFNSGNAAAIGSSTNGTLTTKEVAFPKSLTFYLGRSTNSTAKTLTIEVSTSSATTGFATVATYTHSNVPSGSYNQYTVDLSAYSLNPTVFIRFNKSSTTTSPWRLDDVVVNSVAPTYVSGYQNLSVSGTSQEVTSLSPLTTYYYRVRAKDSYGVSSSNSNTISVTTYADISTADFRSKANGDFSSLSTWEYYTGVPSVGNAGWIDATSLPSGNNNITILATHEVALTQNETINSGATITVNGVFNTSTFALQGAGNLTLANGGTLKIKNLNATDAYAAAVGITGTATLASGSTVELNGAAQQFLGARTFSNLKINNAAGVVAKGDLTVNGILDLSANPNATNGALEMVIDYTGYAQNPYGTGDYTNSTASFNNLNSYVLTMGPSATTVGIGDVTGKIRRTSLVDNRTYSFGNAHTELRLNSVSGSAIPSQITVVATRGTYGTHIDNTGGVAINGTTANRNAVQRLYQILRTGGDVASRFTLRMAYEDGDLNGNTEANLVSWDHHLPYGAITPHEHGKTSANATENWVELSNHSVNYLATEGATAFTKYWMLSAKESLNDYEWLGAVDVPGQTNWNVTSNWKSGKIPNDAANVFIPNASATLYDPVINTNSGYGILDGTTVTTGQVRMRTLEIASGGVLTVASGTAPTITLYGGPNVGGGGINYGSWLNNGTFTAENSTVVFDFDNTATESTIAGSTSFYNVTIANAKKATLQEDAQVAIAGTLTNGGVLDATTNLNTVIFNGSTDQTVVATNGSNLAYYSLELGGTGVKSFATAPSIKGDFIQSGSATITVPSLITFNGSAAQNIVGLNYNNIVFSEVGTKTFTSNGSLSNTGAVTFSGTPGVVDFDGASDNLTFVLKSDASGTARIGNASNWTINGKVTAERYIPAKRAWRLLTAPLKGTSNTSVFANWQGINGEGILLWGPQGTASPSNSNNGLHLGPQANIWSYNNGWVAESNTNTASLFDTDKNKSYIVFATGSHDSGNIATGQAATTLRPKGSLITEDVLYTGLVQNQYQLLANPYASPLSVSSLRLDNPDFAFWLLDPTLGSVGGYYTYDGTNWAPTPPNQASGQPDNNNIQSGQGFFVRSASASQFTIKEVHKTTGNSNTWFERSSSSVEADKIRVLLYKQLNSQWQLADGILAVNSVGGNDGVDGVDTGKMTNFNENIAFRNGTSNLAIEYRGLPTTGTVQQMRLTGTTVQPYQLRVKTEHYSNSGLQPYLEDTQAGTFTLIPTDGSDVVVNFTGMAATAAAPDARFRIVYPSALGVDAPDALSVGVYPNPTEEGVFTILLPLAGETARYTLTNLVGQEVQQGTLDSVSSRVSVSSLQGGVYLLEVNQSGKRFTTKLIIK